MDVKIDKKSETKKELEITISKEEMESYVDKIAQKASSEMNIKGFRPGNAPRDVVENTIGKEKLWEDAAKEAIQDTYPKIIEEKELFAVAQPHVEIIKCAPGNEMVYKAEVYVMPDIKLPDYKKISKQAVKQEKKEVKVDDKEIKDTLDKMKESRAKTQKVDRAAKKGDTVIINLEGMFKGEKDRKIKEENFKVNLGGGELNVFEGLEEKIYGMKEGDKNDFSLKMKAPKSVEDKIDLNVEMISVMERELPEIDDEFAKSFPNIENVKQLKEKIKEGIKSEKENKQKESLKVKVLEKIKKDTDFEVPEVLTLKELDNMINNLKRQVESSGASFEDYLRDIGKTEEELRKEWQKKAEENVSYALILHTISDKEEIEVKDEEIEAEINRHFQALGKNKEQEPKENIERMHAYIHDVIKNQKVFASLSIDN